MTDLAVTSTGVTVGVDTLDADELAQIEGLFIVTVTGSLEIKIASEVAASAVRLMAGSTIELHKMV